MKMTVATISLHFQKWHQGKSPIFCKVCSSLQCDLEEFQTHLKSEHGETKSLLKTSNINQKYPNEFNDEIKFQEHRKKERVCKTFCRTCNLPFRDIDTLNDHINKQHKENNDSEENNKNRKEPIKSGMN